MDRDPLGTTITHPVSPFRLTSATFGTSLRLDGARFDIASPTADPLSSLETGKRRHTAALRCEKPGEPRSSAGNP